MSEKAEGKIARARVIYDEIANVHGGQEEIIARVQVEDLEVLILLEARLASAPRLENIAASVQAIIDRRLHAEQVESTSALRETMGAVRETLVEVERNQRWMEAIGAFIGIVGLMLAAIQVWAVLRERPMPVEIVGERMAPGVPDAAD